MILCMRLGPEGQSVGAEVSHERAITDPQHVEVGQTRLTVRSRTDQCKMSKEKRDAGLCEECLSGWTSELTRRLKELATLMQDLLQQ